MYLTIPKPFRNTFLGYESLFDRLLDKEHLPEDTFPKYNIIKTKDGYVLEFALAGYDKADISIKHDTRRKVLCVSGKSKSAATSDEYLAKYITSKEFLKEFNLAEGVTVVNSTMKNGILSIVLKSPVESTTESVLSITVN